MFILVIIKTDENAPNRFFSRHIFRRREFLPLSLSRDKKFSYIRFCDQYENSTVTV